MQRDGARVEHARRHRLADTAQVMPRLRYKGFATPDEIRTFPKGRGSVVSLDEATVARSVFDPGWRWSTDLAQIMGTRSCQIHHLGHAVSGVLRVRMDDGETADIPPDSIYEIPPGHDAWVVGDEPWVTVEWTSARIAAVGPDGPGERILATVLFTDIVDSTATLQRIGDTAWQDLLRRRCDRHEVFESDGPDDVGHHPCRRALEIHLGGQGPE